MALVVKHLPTGAGYARDSRLIRRLGRSPGEGNGNPLQYSCLENSIFPVKFHGQRSLADCSSWGRKDLDITEQLNNSNNDGSFIFSYPEFSLSFSSAPLHPNFNLLSFSEHSAL